MLAGGSIGVAQAPAARPAGRFVVVLDAGHGGEDGGALLSEDGFSPAKEKDFTLALSVKLRSLLAARGMTVVTTREADVTMDASRRAEIANRAGGQACLSLHAAESGSGVHVFLSSLSPATRTQFVPWKTAQAAWVTRSLALGGVVNSALQQAGVAVTLGRTALTTIDSMTCPAIAVEVAPMSGKSNSGGHGPTARVDDPAYEAQIANAIAAALVEWRAEGGRLGGQQP